MESKERGDNEGKYKLKIVDREEEGWEEGTNKAGKEGGSKGKRREGKGIIKGKRRD